MAPVPVIAAQVLQSGWSCTEPRIAALGDGHINDTYSVVVPSGRFVLQRINTAVFVDPARVMDNLRRIHTHIESRRPGLIPELVCTTAGMAAEIDADGHWWRLWRYVDGARSLDATEDPAIARAAGAAFGTFQTILADLPGPTLEPTIEGFLELPGYLVEFERVLADADNTGLGELDDFMEEHGWLAELYPRGGQIVHGDCKLNNLLFAADGAAEVVAIVDLDTVMPGHWAWDFGDLSRSVLMGSGNHAVLFEALVAGYAGATDVQPSVAELVEAPVHVAFMLGVRFLTDHLAGDRYFKIEQRGDNLDRAIRQFDLVRKLEADRKILERAAEKGLEG